MIVSKVNHILICFLFVQSIQAQFNVEHFNLDNGIPHLNVMGVTQDNDGFLWFATEDGLSKYDGVDFTNSQWMDKSGEDYFSHYWTYKLAFDNQTKWIYASTNDGVVKYDPSTRKFTVIHPGPKSSKRFFFNHPTVLENGRYIHVYRKSKSKKLFFHDVNLDGTLTEWSVDSTFKIKPLIPSIPIFSDGRYVVQFDSVAPPFIVHELPIPDNKLGNKYSPKFSNIQANVDSKGRLWEVNPYQDELKVFKDQQLIQSYSIPFSKSYTHSSKWFQFLIDDNEGGWLMSDSSLVWFDLNGNIENLSPRLNKQKINFSYNKIFEDHQGSIWVATTNGVFRIQQNQESFEVLNDPSFQQQSKIVMALTPSEKDFSVFTIFKKSKYDISNNLLEGIEITNNVTRSFENYYTLFHAPTNMYWTFDSDGMREFDVMLNRQTWTSKSIDSIKLPTFYYRTPVEWLAEDEFVIALGVQNIKVINVHSKEATNFYPFQHVTNNNKNITHALHVIDANNIWISSKKGLLYKIKRDVGIIDSINIHEQYPHLFSVNMNNLVLLPDGTLWTSTWRHGVVIANIETKEVEIITTKEGLSSNITSAVLFDGEYVWVSSYNGVNRIHHKSHHINRYYSAGNESLYGFTENAKHVDKKGNFYFAGQNGIVRFNPQKIETFKINAPPLKFSKIDVFDSQNKNIVDVSVGHSKKLIIPPKGSLIEFEFRLLNYINPEKNLYSVKIEGLDKQWSEFTSQPFARYQYIPPGKYTLKVKAVDALGGPAANTLEMPIHVKTYWYKRMWAKIVFASIILAAIGWIFWLYFQRRSAANEAERVKSLDAFKSRFFTNITHEFKTPLTVISGMAKKVKDEPKEWAEQGGEMILRNAKQLSSLVNELLQLRKLEHGQLDTHVEQGNIVSYLQYLMASAQSFADFHQQTLMLNTDIDELWMDFDRDKIATIFNNLISNAIRYSDNGGAITLTLRQNKNLSLPWVHMTFSDTGIGIPKEKLPYIFDRFYRVKEEKANQVGGSGIGLALVKELVQFFGGRIRAESAVGVGSQFTVMLPITNEAPMAKDIYIEISQFSSYMHPEGKDEQFLMNRIPTINPNDERPILLIVEDNADVRKYVCAVLEKEYQLLVAENGLIGLELAKQHIPDLVLSDVMMPEMDGVTMLEKIKNEVLTSHIPIVMLTAKGQLEDRVEAIEQGAEAYLGKPFHEAELLAIVRNLLQQRKILFQKFGDEGASFNQRSRLSKVDQDYLSKLTGIVNEHITDSNFGVEQFAKLAAISSRQLNRKLKAITESSAQQFIRKIRLNIAMSYLKNGETSIAEVAYAAGFSDPNYFSTIFKKEFGKSPSEV